MSNPRNRRNRAQERSVRIEEQRRIALRRAQRKRAVIGISMVLVIMAVLAGVLIQATKDPTVTAGATSTTSTDPLAALNSSTTSLPDGPPASLPTVPPGASLTGATGCPAADGSSPRTTSFAEAPPMCINASSTYEANVNTSVGTIKFLLNPEQTVSGVNAFVVLAGYHYWDGAPITSVNPGSVFQVGDPNAAGPGFTIPNETPAIGAIYPVGTPALIAGSGNTVDPGQFQVAIGEQAADLPKNTPAFGLMLDGLSTLQAIRRAGSSTGQPTQAITITSIDVVESPPSTTTP